VFHNFKFIKNGVAIAISIFAATQNERRRRFQLHESFSFFARVQIRVRRLAGSVPKNALNARLRRSAAFHAACFSGQKQGRPGISSARHGGQ
jgi:hypothetical protein